MDGSGSLDLKFVTHGEYSDNVGARVYLLDEGADSYYMFRLKNKEFTFDVDVSELGCGINGALYFVEMEEDGGLKYPGNRAGPNYGTGYCDAQCPHDIKWINGEPNMEGWETGNDANSGTGKYGTCCYELDIWEANSMASAYTNHPCTVQGDKSFPEFYQTIEIISRLLILGPGAQYRHWLIMSENERLMSNNRFLLSGQYRCEGTECGDNDSKGRYDGVCDKDGCDYNHWRQGDREYFGVGSNFKVDSSKKMTVVTQFITNDGTDTGELVEIRRIYVQDGKVIENSVTNQPGILSCHLFKDLETLLSLIRNAGLGLNQ